MIRGRKFSLPLTVTAFFMIWAKFSNSKFLFYSSAKIEDFKPSWKYLSIVGLFGALIRFYFNKIDYKCLRWAFNSNIISCWYWETCLNWLKMLLAKPRLFLKFLQKKCLNLAQVIGYLSLEQHLYWCHC